MHTSPAARPGTRSPCRPARGTPARRPEASGGAVQATTLFALVRDAGDYTGATSKWDEARFAAASIGRQRVCSPGDAISGIAVYPGLGWWKTRTRLECYDRAARYALMVNIKAPEVEGDLYAEVANRVATTVATEF